MNASIKYGAALVAALTLFGAAAQAAPVSSNPSFTQNGITFDTFTIAVTAEGAAFPRANTSVNVDLIPGTTGLQFSSGWTASNEGFSDAAISYVARGTSAITSVGLSFDGSFLGFAIASVTETIYADAARLIELGQVIVSCGQDFGCTRTASIALTASYDTLYVTKDINVSAFEAPSRAQISVVNQTYNNPTAVPEPMSIALFGTGLVGLGLVRRARKAGKAA